MSKHNEAFIHFDICIDRLNSARRTLLIVKENASHGLVASAFRFALVEYATPYTRSDGAAKTRHCLSEKYIPEAFVKLHKRLLVSRNRVIAHADIAVLDAKLSYIVKGRRIFPSRGRLNFPTRVG